MPAETETETDGEDGDKVEDDLVQRARSFTAVVPEVRTVCCLSVPRQREHANVCYPTPARAAICTAQVLRRMVTLEHRLARMKSGSLLLTEVEEREVETLDPKTVECLRARRVREDEDREGEIEYMARDPVPHHVPVTRGLFT